MKIARSPWKRAGRSVIWFAVLALLAPQFSIAQDNVLQDSALRFVPADAAFFASLQRNREQFEAVRNSKAWARLQELGYMQDFIRQLKQSPGFQQWSALQQQPQLQALLNVALDSVSNEIFFYGDAAWAKMGTVAQELSMAMNTAQLQAALTGGDPQQAQLRALLQAIASLPEGAQVPLTVVGFKFSNQQNVGVAKELLTQAEAQLGMLAARQETLAGKVQRKQIGGGDYVYIDLDGKMIPWDDAQDAIENQLGDVEFAKIKDRLSKMTLSAGLGVYDQYLVLFIASSADQLARLGSGSSLAGRSEMAKLKPYADRRITYVGYVSDAYVKATAGVQTQLKQLTSMAESLVDVLPISGDQRKELRSDLDAATKQLVEKLPQPGATLTVAWLNGTGYATRSFNWGDLMYDSSRPLDILSHVGGDPIGFIAARGKSSPEDYELLVSFAKKAFHHADAIIASQLEGREKALYEASKKKFLPLLARLDAANRDLLNPALSDHSSAVVLDAKTTSKSWHAFLPVADDPLPMIELGVVCRVTDKDKFLKGMKEYFDVTQEFLNGLSDLSTGEFSDLFPTQIPKITIPDPEEREVAGGQIYFYNLPLQFGVDQQIAPNMGVNDRVAVWSLIPKFSARLMKEKPVASRLQAFGNRPLASCFYLNFAQLIDAVMPWVDYGAALSGQISTRAADDPIEDTKETLKLLKCFDSCWGKTYKEGEVWVSEGQVLIKDIE